MTDAPPSSPRPALTLLAVVGAAVVLYWLSVRAIPWVRIDFFYLADAFLHGRTWLDFRPYEWDAIPIGDRVYIPFGPLPAILLVPLVGLVGPEVAGSFEKAINTGLAAACVGLGWVLVERLGVGRSRDKLALVVLLGLSTPIWWITMRGGVWHTGQLVATVLTLATLVELRGTRRAPLIGLLAGAAFLARPTLILAVPVYVTLIAIPTAIRGVGRERLAALARTAAAVAIGALPAIAFFLWYNASRFGSPLETGYALASLPPFLAEQRDLGLFGLVHLPMNVDYLLLHLPAIRAEFPLLVPDGYGMSILLTSPGLLLALRADPRSPDARLLALAAAVTLAPSLLYYGGGWTQFGYRYALDSIPFVFALAALATARLGRVPRWALVLVGAGVAVNLASVYWAFRL